MSRLETIEGLPGAKRGSTRTSWGETFQVLVLDEGDGWQARIWFAGSWARFGSLCPTAERSFQEIEMCIDRIIG